MRNRKNLNLLKAKIFVAALFFLTNSGVQRIAAQSKEKVHIGFIYPLSTNGTHATLDTNRLSLHVLAGVSAEETGLAFSGLTNVVGNNTRGLLFAGFSNHVRKHAEGLVFGGFANTYGSA